MVVESSRVLWFLPQFSRISRINTVGNGKLRFSVLRTVQKIEKPNEEVKELRNDSELHKFSTKYSDLLPKPFPKYRNILLEKLERNDMIKRRRVIHIPEFYVGSILAVTTSDKHSSGKMTRFLGICIMKISSGLNSKFLLRNVIENQGVEIMFTLYSPLIQKIEVLRLEKRLDDQLLYLRDAPLEYSTFSFDMLQEYHDDSKPVPVNTIKVPLNPRPWIQRYERMNLKGVVLPELSEKIKKQAIDRARPWEKYDLMDEYRKAIPEEEQRDIFTEIGDEIKFLELKNKSEKKRKQFSKPTKQKVF